MTHAELVERAAKWLRGTRRCTVVLTERYVSGETIEIPDAIGWTSRGVSILVECKVSRADLCADQQKPCRRREPELGMGSARYYLTPPGLVSPTDGLRTHWGLLEAHPNQIRRMRSATSQEYNRSLEQRLLLSELSRYQIHGITYPALGDVIKQPIGDVSKAWASLNTLPDWIRDAVGLYPGIALAEAVARLTQYFGAYDEGRPGEVQA